MNTDVTFPFRYILSVSELTRKIRDILETNFFDLWVEGEISNFKIPPSGHIYFTLKDDFSQIRAVLFRMQAKTLRFLPGDGLHVVCRGRVSLYEKRGEYQLILDAMEPKGIGALQLAFLQLKEKLEREGLFDRTRKKTLPFLPQRIGIVTSPTGAVIRDMIHIIHRRFENVRILLYPARVQGEGSTLEIVEGIEYFNRQMSVDVIIVGRGGGSLEDLWAFNEEAVARAIHASQIPIISAVGHETDYTIADFVADLRAPTPSAAAELIVKEKKEIKKAIHSLRTRLVNEILQKSEEHHHHLFHLEKRRLDPRRKVEDYFLRVDDLLNRCRFLANWRLERTRERYSYLDEKLWLRSPGQIIKNLREWTSQLAKRLNQNIKRTVEINRQRWIGIQGKLDSLGPLSILQRGYSITRIIPSLEVLKSTAQVAVGEKVEVILHQGTILCSVEKKEGP
jgi:exodeoxyribonuclease VII large subunit